MILSLVLATALAAPQRVDVGVYLRNVDGLDFRNNSYTLSLTLWMKWKGDIDPTKTFLLVNAIEMWGLQITPAFEAPRTLDDGTHFQRFHVEGRFFHKFWLGNFPLDWQKVTLEVEDTVHPATELEYVADSSSHTQPELAVPGWEIAETYNLAQPVTLELGDAKTLYPHYRYGLKLRRAPTFFLLKILPPILIMIICCVFVMRLRAQWVDARTGTIVVALLTQVFLQQQFIALLPGVGMQMLLDQIFNLSYVVMAGLLIESIIVSRWWDIALKLDEQHVQAVRAEVDAGDDYAAVALPGDPIRRRIDTLDRLCFIGAPALYALALIVTVWLMRGAEMFG